MSSNSDNKTQREANKQEENSAPLQVDNKRVAKNTLMLYVRMLISMVVSLYTSRVVLATLGVDDYGIYGLVGGVVAMFTFLNTSMSGATSRFLTFELGKGDKTRLKETFSSAFIVHCIIALAVLVLAETIGLWFLCYKLVIPPERMVAAHVVYQLSVISTMVNITQVPYSASMMSHERFDVYAYMEILNVTLKLLIVYLLLVISYDKLIVYAFLVFAVSVVMLLLERGYCMRHFKEAHLHWVWKKEYLRPLLSFSSWDLYGNGCVAAAFQGRNFLINMFFGVAYNAAASVAGTVSSIIRGLSLNVVSAYRPVIIKLYAQERVEEMERSMMLAAKFSSLIYGCLAVPLIIEMDYVLQLWLGTPPDYAAIFCRIILTFGVIDMLVGLEIIAIHASGRIKRISLLSGSLFLVLLFLQYLGYKFLHLPVESIYVIHGVMGIFLLCSNILIAKHNIPQLSLRGHAWTLCRVAGCFGVAFGLTYVLSHALAPLLPGAFVGLIVTVLVGVLLMVGTGLLLMLNHDERRVLVEKVQSKLHR